MQQLPTPILSRVQIRKHMDSSSFTNSLEIAHTDLSVVLYSQSWSKTKSESQLTTVREMDRVTVRETPPSSPPP